MVGESPDNLAVGEEKIVFAAVTLDQLNQALPEDNRERGARVPGFGVGEIIPPELEGLAPGQGMGIAAALRGDPDPDLTQRPACQTPNPLDRQMDPHRLEADGYRAKLSPDHPFSPDFIRTTCRATQGIAILVNMEMDGALVERVADMLVAANPKCVVE